MKSISITAKSAKANAAPSNTETSVESDGIAFAPPAYGIESLDSAQAGAIQMKTTGSTLPNRTGLPDALKSGIEGLSGLSLDDVRVHYNSSKPAGLQALAYTQGVEIHVAPGQERHLPHEAWHVVQQKQGRVKPTGSISGAPLNDSPQLEQEADRPGSRAEHPPFRQPAASPAASAGVVQGVFVYEGKEVKDKERASELARQIYARLTERMQPSAIKISKEDFINLVANLAGPYRNHGVLDDSYFSRLIAEGRIDEVFSFKAEGRRIETIHNPNANYPPLGSYFQQRLLTEKPKSKRKKKTEGSDSEQDDELVPDLSYTDLRRILENTLGNNLTREEIDQAIRAGVEKFSSVEPKVSLDPELDIDLQLIPQHLLKYQSFNRGQLKETEKNRSENAFRSLVMEISKRMIVEASNRLDKIVPPTPDFSKGGQLQHALPGLIDVNRPLSNSMFGEETYKAVFILTHRLLRMAYDRAQVSLREGQQDKDTPLTVEAQIDEQRKFLNPSFFELLPNMEGSTIGTGEGKQYTTKNLRIPYNEGNESFDESLSDEESKEMELSSDEEIYHSGEDIFRASQKRSTFLNSFGLLTKMTGQKELLDPQNEENTEKYRQQHTRLQRRTRQFNQKYEKRFRGITQELAYVTQKEKLILKHITKIENELETLKYFQGEEEITEVKKLLGKVTEENPLFGKVSTFNTQYGKLRANTVEYKKQLRDLRKRLRKDKEYAAKLRQRIEYLKDARAQARKLRDRLGDFYFETPVGDILEQRERSSRWKDEYPEVFSNLGPQSIQTHIFSNPPKRRSSDRSPSKERVKSRKIEKPKESKKEKPEQTSSSLAEMLKKFLHKYYEAQGENSVATLLALGFSYHPQLGDENDCALYTIYHQLTMRYGLKLENFDAFRDYVRKAANFQFGSMIDILNNGQPLLAAVQAYLQSLGYQAPALVIDVWAATVNGGLFEYQNVAQSSGSHGQLVLTFYYNGYNHFDSLTGGLSRN